MHFEQGTGDPVWEARFLAVQALLARTRASWSGPEYRLSRAAEILRAARNPAAVASVEIQRRRPSSPPAASGGVGAGRRRPDGATPEEARLQMRASSLVIECLAGLRRPVEALRSFLAAGPLAEPLGDRLGALFLDALERGGDPAAEPGPQPLPGGTPESLFDAAIERLERQLIAVGLSQCGGCILETSRLLDFVRNTLKAKMKKYGFEGAWTAP